MNKINTFEDAKQLVKDGMQGLAAVALIGTEASAWVHADDQINQQAGITIYMAEGASPSDHYVLECQSKQGSVYLLCIHVGNGGALTSYTEDELVSFREECEDNDLILNPEIPVLLYSYKGISLVI